MHVFYYYLAVLPLLHQGSGEDVVDCTHSLGKDNTSQTFCEKLLDRRDAERKETAIQRSLSVEFICQSEGRFPDLSDSTCMRYFQCEERSDGTFSQKSLKCPNSTFCSSTQKCSSVHICPCSATTNGITQTPPESHETTVKTTSHPCSISYVVEFNCTTVGRFPDFSDLTCRAYFLCSHLYNGSFIKTEYKCQNSFFDPVIKRCSANSTCPCTTTTSASSTTVTTPTSKSSTDGSGTTNHITQTSPNIQETTIKTTIHPCSTSSIIDFNCTSVGRFPDFSDLTCRAYFLCSHLYNGSFIKTEYKCQNSFFDPVIKRCTVTFTCPCMVTTTASLTMVTTLPSKSSIGGSGTTNSITQTSPESYETTVKTTYHPCSTSSITDFSCITVGRFPDFNDLTCRAYFLCSHLNNGSFIKTEYKCQNSFFDPVIKRCTVKYTCPCTATTSASSTITTTLTSKSSTEGSMPTSVVTSPTTPVSTSHLTSERETTSSATISSQSTGSPTSEKETTSSVTSTNHGCTTVSEEFECENEGRFPDLSDLTCKKYFLCSKLRNETFIKTPYECQYSSFNPLTLRCSVGYLCPCTVDSSASVTTPLSSDSSSFEGFTTPPVVTSTSEVITLLPTIFSTHEENSTIATSSLSSSTVTSSISANVPGCTASSQEFECTVIGRFADLTDFTCKKYFLCSQLRNGKFVKTKYRCPNVSIFYPPFEQCSAEYTCPCIILTSTSTMSTSKTNHPSTESSVSSETSPHTSTPLPITPIENTTILTSSLPSSAVTPACKVSSEDDFLCTAEGRFPDLTDFTCKKYFLCSHLRNGSFIKTKYRCPSSSNFYPPSEKCSMKYVCPCTATTSTLLPTVTSLLTFSTEISSHSSTLTTDSHENITIPSNVTSNYSNSTTGCIVSYNEFQCTAEGRYPDLSDTTCRNYFLCSKLRNETYIKTSYACLNSFFNPLLLKCSISYVCPCNDYTSVTTPISSSAILTEGFTKAPTITTTVSYTCVSPSADTPEYNCSSVGRFPDYSDITCRKYFLCSQLHNGTFLKTSYTCPTSSCINSSIQRCSSTCKCPCI